MPRYRVTSAQAHIRGHLLPIKKGERVYRGKLAQGTVIEGRIMHDADGVEWVGFFQDGRPGFVWKARVQEVPDVSSGE
jgi:hypothetical protein